MKPVIKKALFLAAVVLFFYTASCLFYGIRNPVVAVMGCGSVSLAAYPHVAAFLPRWLRISLSSLAGAGAMIAAALTCWMLHAAYWNPPRQDSPPRTVVVLGAQIQYDKPSLMLTRRLDAAFSYLQAHPDAVAVVSGGLGEGESFTEAAVMKQYLVDKGIPAERVLEEGQSTNTGENLRYSAQIIRQNHLDTRIAICTDGFHQLRASLFAKREGLTPFSIPCQTPWGVAPMYYIREWVGLAKLWLLGR